MKSRPKKKTIKILDRTYTQELIPPADPRLDGNKGMTYPDLQKIYLSADLIPEQMQRTEDHELMHVVANHADFHGYLTSLGITTDQADRIEEHMCVTIGEPFGQIIRGRK